MPAEPISVSELLQSVEQEIEIIRTDMEAYDERLSLQHIEDGKTTTIRAIDALNRLERFKGEHDVARSWLRDAAPGIGIFRRRIHE